MNKFEEALIQIKSKSSFLGLKQANGNIGTQTGDLDEKTCENYDIN